MVLQSYCRRVKPCTKSYTSVFSINRKKSDSYGHKSCFEYETDKTCKITLKNKSLMTIGKLSNEELKGLIDHAITLKKSRYFNSILKEKSMAMIFQKRSTRTRGSTETGMAKLGGHALMLSSSDIQLGQNETMKDTGYKY